MHLCERCCCVIGADAACAAAPFLLCACLQVCRLFDLFLATHPLMPLYVGAAAMHSQRQQLLAAEEMPILHSKLVNLCVTKMATADQLAIQVGRRGSWGPVGVYVCCQSKTERHLPFLAGPQGTHTERLCASAHQCCARSRPVCCVPDCACCCVCLLSGHQAVQTGHTGVHHSLATAAAAAVHHAARGAERRGVALPGAAGAGAWPLEPAALPGAHAAANTAAPPRWVACCRCAPCWPSPRWVL